MQQILLVWTGLDTRRRIIVALATVAMFAAVLGLTRMASQPSMSLLYSGLDASAAGEVVAALEQQGVTYEVREGAILVDASRRDALRMTLAAEGMPANNGQGYELLDTLSGFGTTSQMFDAAYQRAKEGELARTIVASPQIKGARVHISNPSSNPFQRDLKPTASVTVTARAGGITSAHAKALKYLVASAVAGLAPDDVSVIDGRGGLVLPGDETPGTLAGGSERALELRRNIERILEARVGFGNAVVEVSVETVTESEAIVERRFDPENRVAISTETEERSTTSSGSQSGSVTVASNLPEGDAGSENSSRSENSETRERVNFEVSETTREVVRTPGGIRRVSVAVLIDGLSNTDPATGEVTWQPRPEDELEALRELVASAVGFDADRGDTITLKSMQFEPLTEDVPDAAPSLLQALHLDTMSLIQLAVLAIVALVLGLFVVRPILSTRPLGQVPALAAPGRAGLPALAGDPAAAGMVPGLPDSEFPGETNAGIATGDFMGDLPALSPAPALTGEIDDGFGPLPDLAFASAEEMMSGSPSGESEDEDDPIDRLRRLIEERKEETVEILRSWMEDHEEPA